MPAGDPTSSQLRPLKPRKERAQRIVLFVFPRRGTFVVKSQCLYSPRRTLITARCQNRCYLVLECLVPSLNGDLPSGINVPGIENHQGRIRGYSRIEVNYHARLPVKTVAIAR